MPSFKSTEQLYQVIGGFFKHLSKDPSIGPKLLNSNLKIRFHYKQPDGCIYIDFSEDQIQVKPGNSDDKADIEMSMKADTAHKFWQGKVNLVMALTRREITAKGPIPKILKLLPIIKPSYKMYVPYLTANDFQLND